MKVSRDKIARFVILPVVLIACLLSFGAEVSKGFNDAALFLKYKSNYDKIRNNFHPLYFTVLKAKHAIPHNSKVYFSDRVEDLCRLR